MVSPLVHRDPHEFSTPGCCVVAVDALKASRVCFSRMHRKFFLVLRLYLSASSDVFVSENFMPLLQTGRPCSVGIVTRGCDGSEVKDVQVVSP